MNLRDEIIDYLLRNISLRYTHRDQDESFDEIKHEKEVKEELNDHIRNSEISKLFLMQLTFLHAKNYVVINNKAHPYNITEIYWDLEKIVKGKVEHKPFDRKKSMLYGKNLLHSHHSRSFYTEDNHIRYFKKKYPTEESVIEAIKNIKHKSPEQSDVSTFVITTLLDSIEWEEKTGEWIIFKKEEEKIKFIALALHQVDDRIDENIYEQIKEYI